MSEVLRNATWCHPLCAQDHLDIVERLRARRPRRRPSASSPSTPTGPRQTMRRAMDDEPAARAAAVHHAGPVRRQGRRRHRRGSGHRRGDRPPDQRRRRHIWCWPTAPSWSTSWPMSWRRRAERWRSPPTSSTYEGARPLSDRQLARFGRIDVLVNNVGGAINFKPFTEFTDAEIRAEIDRSLMTTLYTCRAVLPSMVERGRRASSSTSPRRPPAASTGSPTPRPRAGSTRSPPRWHWSTPTPASASSPPLPAAPRRRRAGSRGARRSRRTTRARSGSRPTSTRRSTPH